MTKDEILQLGAGPQLDRLIATKIFGYKHRPHGTVVWPQEHWKTDGINAPYAYKPETLPCYSTDIAAAWRIVEKLIHFTLENNCNPNDLVWCAGFLVGPHWVKAEATTAELAICRAALLVTYEKRSME